MYIYLRGRRVAVSILPTLIDPSRADDHPEHTLSSLMLLGPVRTYVELYEKASKLERKEPSVRCSPRKPPVVPPPLLGEISLFIEVDPSLKQVVSYTGSAKEVVVGDAAPLWRH